jgi:hypothetical protein
MMKKTGFKELDINNIKKRLQFYNDWLVPDKEIPIREEYIKDCISSWIEQDNYFKAYFDNPPIKILFETVLLLLSPISYEMIDDFIEGLALMAYKKESYKNKINDLLRPTWIKISEFYFTKPMQDDMIDRWVPKKDKLLISIFEIGTNEIPTRTALKNYIKENPTIVNSQKIIDQLKFEFLLSKREFYKKISTKSEILTYEKLFTDLNDCKRITKIINEQSCNNGIFVGFQNISGTPRNQILIAYDIIKDRFLKPVYASTKGSIEESKQLFLKHFGWKGVRDTKTNEDRVINFKKSSVDYTTKPNKDAKKNLEFLLK